MAFRPTSGHCHHVNFFIFNETENCAGGISSANVLNVERAFFQILVADLIQPLFCGLLFPFLSLIDMCLTELPMPILVMDAIFDHVKQMHLDLIFIHQRCDVSPYVFFIT